MSSKILLSFLGGCLALFLVMGITTYKSEAQVVSGKTAEPSGQLVVPFIVDGSKDTFVQVTNTNPDLPVNIHLQLMDGESPTCAECDFFDTLTPADTVVYQISDLMANELLIDGSRADKPCDQDGVGVLVITPTVGTNPDQADAIAHNHLHGLVNIINSGGNLGSFMYTFNAVGRDAVLASGAKALDGTLVDGVGAGFSTIIPGSYNIQYSGPGTTGSFDDIAGAAGSPVFSDAIFVAITDDYAGGYNPQPGTSPTFAIDVFDDDEIFQSCDETSFTCIDIRGVNDSHDTTLLEQGDASDCDLTPPDDIGCFNICSAAGADHETGYTRLRSTVAGTADVNFAILGLAVTDAGGASHIFVK